MKKYYIRVVWHSSAVAQLSCLLFIDDNRSSFFHLSNAQITLIFVRLIFFSTHLIKRHADCFERIQGKLKKNNFSQQKPEKTKKFYKGAVAVRKQLLWLTAGPP